MKFNNVAGTGAIGENKEIEEGHNGVAGFYAEIRNSLEEMQTEILKRFVVAELEIITSGFVTKIGHGTYGCVYSGQFRSGTQVAVKVLLNCDVVEQIFMDELQTMLASRHRNLVKLYGYCFDESMKALVYEYVENGSLDKILNGSHDTEWDRIYDIAVGTAKGLSYLHADWHKTIIHHDIKASNVLLDAKFCPKITDYGLPKLLGSDVSSVIRKASKGIPAYVAPEVWHPFSEVTAKCDVYSFGMLLFEVLMGKNFMQGQMLGKRNSKQGQKWFPVQVWEKVRDDVMGEFLSKKCGIKEINIEEGKILALVALWCVQYIPENRPPMSTVVNMLEMNISVALPPHPFDPSPLFTAAVAPLDEYSSDCKELQRDWNFVLLQSIDDTFGMEGVV